MEIDEKRNWGNGEMGNFEEILEKERKKKLKEIKTRERLVEVCG